MVRVLVYLLNVTDEGSCSAAANAVHTQHGVLDVLINNAGIGHVGTIQATDGIDLDRLDAVNVRGVFNVTKAFIGEVLRRRMGLSLTSHRSAGCCYSPSLCVPDDQVCRGRFDQISCTRPRKRIPNFILEGKAGG
jgi:NAD(P)-dependent dehydrogenase (short-subunit alcohol dehydrogenase family)